MNNSSLWIKDLKIKKYKVLNKNINTDILIIGGGLTGLSCAYYLKNSNLNICLVESKYIGMGVSSKTTGKVTYLQETIYTDIEEKTSFDTAKKYFDSQKFAINEIKKIIDTNKIDCNFYKVKSYIFTDNDDDIENIENEKNLLEKFGVKVKKHDSINIKLNSKYAISTDDTYIFHPIKFIYSLKELCEKDNVNIYEQTKIIEIKKKKDNYICYTKNVKIKAKKVIIACHYPFFLKPFFLPLKVHNEKSYVTASIVKDYKDEIFITSKIPTKSIRYHKDNDNYLIYLSNSHNICNSVNYKDNFNKTISEAKKLKLNPKYVWSNEDLITVDKIPYIGRLEENNDNLLIGTGYNTWGMTNSVLAGYILSDIIKGNKNEFEELTNPLRTLNCSGVIVNIGSNLKSIIQNKVSKNKNWYNNIKFETRNGKSVAIYNDGKKEHIVYTTCPHLGCTLIFNEFEKTWDCPCHASRFDIDGKCIKGPSKYNISYKEKD